MTLDSKLNEFGARFEGRLLRPADANYEEARRIVPTLRDEVIDNIIEHSAHKPSPQTLLLVEHLHGAAARVPVSATAFPHRQEHYGVLAMSIWPNPSDSDQSSSGRDSCGRRCGHSRQRSLRQLSKSGR